MKKYCTHRYTSLIVTKFPIKIKKNIYRNALILTQDRSNQSCRVRLTHVRTERYILIVSTLRVKAISLALHGVSHRLKSNRFFVSIRIISMRKYVIWAINNMPIAWYLQSKNIFFWNISFQIFFLFIIINKQIND